MATTDEMVYITMNISVSKPLLLSAIESNKPIVLHVQIDNQLLAKQSFFESNKETIQFLMLSLDEMDLSVRVYNNLKAFKIEYCYEIADRWEELNTARKFRLNPKSKKELETVYEERNLSVDSCDPALLSEAQDRIKR